MPRQAGGICGDQEQGDTAHIARATRRPRRNQQPLGPRRARDHHLFAIDRPAVRILFRRRRDRLQRLPAVSLARGEDRAYAAVGQLRQQRRRPFPAGAFQQPCGDHGRLDIGEGRQRLAQRVGDHHRLDRASAQATRLDRQRRAEHAEITAKRLPQRPGVARPMRIEREALRQIARERVTQHHLLVAERKIHSPLPTYSWNAL